MLIVTDQCGLFYEGCDIMDKIGEYILCITAAAIICAIIKSIIDPSTPFGKIIKIICGVFMAVTLLSPLTGIELNFITDYLQEYDRISASAMSDGTQLAYNELSGIIKQQVQTYILDKALDLGLDVDVEVKLTDSNPPTPYQVILTGTASPYKKQMLSQYIIDNLGITQENLKWT